MSICTINFTINIFYSVSDYYNIGANAQLYNLGTLYTNGKNKPIVFNITCY